MHQSQGHTTATLGELDRLLGDRFAFILQQRLERDYRAVSAALRSAFAVGAAVRESMAGLFRYPPSYF
jgi:hypothetical protein